MNSEQPSSDLPPHPVLSSHQEEKIIVDKQISKFENLSLKFSYQIKDKDGNILEDSGIRPCKSFVKQFLQLMSNIAFCTTRGVPITITDTSGASQTSIGSMFLRTNASSGVSSYGLQVGTGTNAESISNTKLQTQVAHGTSAGQLQYGTVTYGAPSTTATTTTFRVTRVFTNGSGGSITVQEVAIVSEAAFAQTAGFLLARDLTGGVAIGNGLSMTLNFDFTTTI